MNSRVPKTKEKRKTAETFMSKEQKKEGKDICGAPKRTGTEGKKKGYENRCQSHDGRPER